MAAVDYRGQTTLITGVGAGPGAEFACRLAAAPPAWCWSPAARNARRSRPPGPRAHHRIQAHVVPMDLAEDHPGQALAAQVEAARPTRHQRDQQRRGQRLCWISAAATRREAWQTAAGHDVPAGADRLLQHVQASTPCPAGSSSFHLHRTGSERAEEQPTATVEQVGALADVVGPRWCLLVY
ncbi:hypothetical protein [Streptomyces chattanoogensis]|uniref:Short-chain dehydrogenase n=1 Tax=Streptomyces chattanoogensis TaxID=66876 RepID=A0A0N0H1B1_9ACTN|nr:hypothetical protein [Streptomyces chattanoogensis]KPC64342.1 hypothetical protein ADL29_12560 [Streptomyces chattanoogensis]